MKILVAAFLAAWYFWFLPITWHADDEAVFGESRRFAAQAGTFFLAVLPPTIFAAVWWLKKAFK